MSMALWSGLDEPRPPLQMLNLSLQVSHPGLPQLQRGGVTWRVCAHLRCGTKAEVLSAGMRTTGDCTAGPRAQTQPSHRAVTAAWTINSLPALILTAPSILTLKRVFSYCA